MPRQNEELASELDPLGHLTTLADDARSHPSRIVRWLARSPFFEPFCKVTGPLMHWLAQPENTIIAALWVVLGPFLALLLLPLIILLVPVFLFLSFVALLAVSFQTDAESDPHESLVGPLAA